MNISNPQIIKDFANRFNRYFTANKEEILKKEIELGDLLTTFLEKFDVKKMTLPEYCFESGNKNTYCYWIEYILTGLGDIRIQGQGGFQKFHIQKIDGQYVFKRNGQKYCKFGEDENTVFANIKKELIKLIQASKDMDIDTINSSLIHQTIRAKITYLYNEDNWIPIYVDNHINRILSHLGIQYTSKNTLTEKRVLLFKFYQEVRKLVPYITTWEFMKYVYNPVGLRSVVYSSGVSPSDDIDTPIRHISNYKVVDETGFNVVQHTLTTRSGSHHQETERSLKNKKRIGDYGETIVRDYLLEHASEMNIRDIKTPGLDGNDGEHHDISYIDSSGQTIYIDVKATSKYIWPNIYFEMSIDEYLFLKEHIDHYYIYYIADIFNTDIIHRISGEEVLKRVTPCKYCFEGTKA